MRYILVVMLALFVSACATKEQQSGAYISGVDVVEENSEQFIDYTWDIKDDVIEEYLEEGLDYADDGNIDKACELWEEAITSTPIAVSLYYNYALCVERNGEHNKAISILTYANDLAPNKKILKLINEALVRNISLAE